MSLIEIATFGNPIEAELARGALEAAGIEAVLFDRGVSSTYAGALNLASARLMVPHDCEQAARALLDSAR